VTNAEEGGTLFDVPHLLEVSRPTPTPWLVFVPPVGLACLVGAFAAAAFATSSPWGLVLGLVLLLGSIGCTVLVARLASAARRERQAVREVEELVSLRRWPEAGAAASGVLSQPMRLPPHRRGVLVALVRTLGRYGRYDEAADLAGSLLEESAVDPATRFSLGCGRAMLLLRAGRLGDANDAIGELRSQVRQVQSAARRAERVAADRAEQDDDEAPSENEHDAKPVTFDPAPLILVEMYRDVQTRHDAEVIEIFREHRDTLRPQIGSRLGDALALAAVAAHRLGQTDDAGRWWGDATALQPAVELQRRIPEVAEITGIYEAVTPPIAEGGS
jgi:hypothetical protein